MFPSLCKFAANTPNAQYLLKAFNPLSGHLSKPRCSKRLISDSTAGCLCLSFLKVLLDSSSCSALFFLPFPVFTRTSLGHDYLRYIQTQQLSILFLVKTFIKTYAL